jgi:hypothetical protein
MDDNRGFKGISKPLKVIIETKLGFVVKLRLFIKLIDQSQPSHGAKDATL